MKTLIAAAAVLALLSTTAYSASCSGTLTNNCIVIDSDGDFAQEGAPNPGVNLGVDTNVGINEIFAFFTGNIGDFTTTGDFDVDGGLPQPTIAKVTVSQGTAGQFNALDLAFNGDPSQSILPGGTFFFALVAGALNTFSITGTANPVFAGPISYTVALSAIPIPPALLLFGTALGGLGLLARRRRRA